MNPASFAPAALAGLAICGLAGAALAQSPGQTYAGHGADSVPREKLVTELKNNSVHRSTQELEPDGALVLTLEFDL